MQKVVGQQQLVAETFKIVQIFKSSECTIRPHFILTGPSGSGKSHLIGKLAEENELAFLEINAAQLTKEGTSGNSLSKALSPLLMTGGRPAICFVDEFDKLFISGNSNDSCAHESTTGVQNEFLKVLESKTTSVFGDYGKYVAASTEKVLFIFAGAFNGEKDIDLDRLRELGIKTEFLGRVGLVYNTNPLNLAELFEILDNSDLLESYLKLYPRVEKKTVVDVVKEYIERNYEMNTLGARIIPTLINQYFIKGGKLDESVKEITFQKELTL
jgi:ATP-dependent protease Clp ATPase subunit